MLDQQRLEAHLTQFRALQPSAFRDRKHACRVVIVKVRRTERRPVNTVLRLSILIVGHEESTRFPAINVPFSTFEYDSENREVISLGFNEA